jgi:hypothetical protein
MTTLSRPTFRTVPLRGRRFKSRLATAILLLAVLVAGVWFERAPLLRVPIQ